MAIELRNVDPGEFVVCLVIDGFDVVIGFGTTKPEALMDAQDALLTALQQTYAVAEWPAEAMADVKADA